MTDGGGDTGFHLRLSDEAYGSRKKVAEGEGMTTAGLLEMIGRQLAAQVPIDVALGRLQSPTKRAGARRRISRATEL